MTKALVAFNAVLTFYILNSQDRRFAQVDGQAKAALAQASEEMRGSVSDALSFGKMFTGAFGGKFGGGGGGGGGGGRQQPAAGGGAGGAAGPGGGFDSLPDAPEGDGQSAWPSGGGGGGA